MRFKFFFNVQVDFNCDASEILAAFGIRKTFSKEQQEGLNNFFLNVTQYPTKEQKNELSENLRLTLKQVSMWFDNKRRKVVSGKKQYNQIKMFSMHKSFCFFYTQSAEILLSTFGIRTGFTAKQLDVLTSSYEQNRYPTNEQKIELSTLLGVPVSRVHKWFDNRRQKDRKSKLF